MCVRGLVVRDDDALEWTADLRYWDFFQHLDFGDFAEGAAVDGLEISADFDDKDCGEGFCAFLYGLEGVFGIGFGYFDGLSGVLERDLRCGFDVVDDAGDLYCVVDKSVLLWDCDDKDR